MPAAREAATRTQGRAAGDPVEIVRADPSARRRALTLVAGGTVCGSIAIHWGLPWLRQAADQAVRDGLPRVVVCRSTLVALMLFTIPLIGFGVHAFRLGRQVALEQCFPPPGRAVVRDTHVLRGRTAIRVGRIQSVLGLFIVFLSAALLAVLAYGLVRLLPA